MRVAILGAGFAGLATCWHILNKSQAQVTVDLYDPQPIGGGVSGLSSGLLHSFTGRHARHAWKSGHGLRAAHELLTVASRTVGESFVSAKGILRPALNEEQIIDFKKCAAEHSETEWWDRETCLENVTGLKIPESHGGGLFIKNGLTLDVPKYLEGLWQASARLGAQFHQTALVESETFEKYDRIVMAMGHAITSIPPLNELPIHPVKGQLLVLKWPERLPHLPFTIVSGVHVAMCPDYKTCILGSTYEHDFKTPNPDPEVAIPELRQKVEPFFPELAKAEVLDIRAGIRASTKGQRLPILGNVSEKVWFITGMGSKGLLYHAWLGECLATAILENEPELIPGEVRQLLRRS